MSVWWGVFTPDVIDPARPVAVFRFPTHARQYGRENYPDRFQVSPCSPESRVEAARESYTTDRIKERAVLLTSAICDSAGRIASHIAGGGHIKDPYCKRQGLMALAWEVERDWLTDVLREAEEALEVAEKP